MWVVGLREGRQRRSVVAVGVGGGLQEGRQRWHSDVLIMMMAEMAANVAGYV